MKHLFTLLATILFLPLYGQISFYNANDRLETSDFHSGVAIGIADMNNDGFDDIIRLSNGRILNIEIQRPDASQFENYEIEQLSNQSQWSMCVADLNNDGYNEIVSGGAYDGVKLVSALNDGAQYEMTILPGDDMFLQGSNLVDINNDGFVDYFACHDDAESRIWANDGFGNLEKADEWIDMTTTPTSDNSGNYGSIWTDFDLDGDIDLYIAKCRQGVNDSSDPRRINALFVNDGNGNFSEQAEAANLKIGAQSWTADFQDIDNDGDYDCFITNHDAPSMLLENDGTGVFTDITEGSGIEIGGLPIQGVMRDFDNDGFVDILVAGTEHYLFLNNGDQTFTEVEGLFDANEMESYAIGDLNHDGFLDIYGGYAQIYTNPSNIDDVIWMNSGDSGHSFLSVRLIGEESNRNGIGARIEIYGEWGIQVREVRAGESYGIMNSMTQHFGLGSSSEVDSLIVRWPSGQIDQFIDMAGGQFVTIKEGDCISPLSSVEVEGDVIICEGDSVLISATATGMSYLWSTGATTQSIWVQEAGEYTVEVSDGGDCSASSPAVAVVASPDETPEITVEGTLRFCPGGEVSLISSDAESYLWSTGATTPAITVGESGEYTVTIEGTCEAFTSAIVTVEQLDALPPELIDYQEGADSIQFTVSGSNPYWYETEVGFVPFAIGNTAMVAVDGVTASAYVENKEIYMGEAYQTGMESHQGSEYSGNGFNGSVIFDCLKAFTLREVTVYTDTPGPRIIELISSEGEVLQSLEVVVSAGISTLTLDFEVEPGVDMELTTNTNSNVENFGFESPRLQRSNMNVQYPYVVEDVVRLTGANLGNSRYYYFFNWVIQEESFECISERVEFTVIILDTEETFEGDKKLSLYPNPASQDIIIELPAHSVSDYQLSLMNGQGQIILQQEVVRGQNTHTLDISYLPAGVYAIRLESKEGTYSGKLIKQ